MSLAFSNMLAAAAAISLPVAGKVWIAPGFIRRCFFTLATCGLPFVIGQFAQEDKWGPLWVQYHLLDLAYAPWGTALVMCVLTVLKPSWMTEKRLFGASFLVIIGFGYLSEVWDTLWSWHDGLPLAQAIDVNDYATITLGGAVALAVYLWHQRMAATKMAMS